MSNLVPVDNPLEAIDVRGQLKYLRDARDWVNTCWDAKEAKDAYKRSQLIKEWVKIQKASAQIAVEAVRLEATVLRRLAALNALDGLSADRKRAAVGFASMDDGAFEGLLQSTAVRSSAASLWRLVLLEQQEVQWKKRGRQIAQGDSLRPIPVEGEELRGAVRTVIATVLARDESISVTSAAMELADALDMRDQFAESAVIRSGIKSAIREAMKYDLSLTEDGDYPEWITYQEQDAGWVHVPLALASAEQVFAWDDFRQFQLKDYIAKADRSGSIAIKVREAQRVHPRTTSVASLLHLKKHE